MPDNNLLKAAESARSELLKTAKSLRNVGAFLETLPDAAFVKKVDGALVAANSHYDAIYGRGHTTAGREPARFLSQPLAAIAQHSDAMLKQGCDYVLFEHTLGSEPQDKRLSGGELNAPLAEPEMMLRTAKVTLLGRGERGWLCLGLTRRLRPLPPDRFNTIRQQWQRYESLPVRDRQCFQMLGQGNKVSDIARQLGIDPKTVQRIRDELLELFVVPDNVAFTHLCVRFHDAGYDDFGL